MNEKLLRFFILTSFFSCHLALGQVEIVPKWFDAQDSITIRYNADQGNAALKGMNAVYGHFGLLTDQSTDSSDWKFTVGQWGQDDPQVRMNALGNDQFEFGYTISSFHGLSGQQQVNALAMVFRNSEGTVIGKNADGSDIIHYGSDGSFQSGFTNTGSLYAACSSLFLDHLARGVFGKCIHSASARRTESGAGLECKSARVHLPWR